MQFKDYKSISKVCRNEINNFQFERFENHVVQTWDRNYHFPTLNISSYHISEESAIIVNKV